MTRWWGIGSAVGGGLLVAAASWMALAPVDWCLMHPSLPPQGACRSRLGRITPLGPGESATPFALLTGAATAGVAWALAFGHAWRRGAVVATVVALTVGVLTVPVACEWVIPAGHLLHPDELVRSCSNRFSVTTAATRPQDAARWSITAGFVALMAVRGLDRSPPDPSRSPG